MGKKRQKGFWHRHGLGISASVVLATWIALYVHADPNTHWGSFFGNAIADWTGTVVTVYATKFMYEIGSAESRRPNPKFLHGAALWLYDHSLTLFLVVTGIGWIAWFAHSNPQAKWGQVIGNIVSEWTQIFGLVVLTKRLMEVKSKE
ncbi:MAG TPA: hypothetical protein VGL89_09720 [Candidatus Koribacter sp.]